MVRVGFTAAPVLVLTATGKGKFVFQAAVPVLWCVFSISSVFWFLRMLLSAP